MYSSNNKIVFAGLPLHNEVEFVRGFKGFPINSSHIHSGRGGNKHNIQNDRHGYDRHGNDRHGYDRHGLNDRHGYDRHGNDRHGYDRHGLNDRHGYDRHGLNDFNNHHNNSYHNRNDRMNQYQNDDDQFVQSHEVYGAFVERKKTMGIKQHYWHCKKCGLPHTHDPQYGCNTPDALGNVPLNWMLYKQLKNQKKEKKVLSYETGIAPYGVASLGGLAHGIMPNRKFRYPVYK